MTRKILDLTGLTTYDEQIKSYIDVKDASTVTKLTDGTTTVKNAEHATSADSATKATQDADGNVITDTYATKTELAEATKTLTIEDIDAICGVDDVTALVNAEFLFEATDSEGNTLTDNVDNTYVF